MRACRHCQNISEETVCPVCNNTDFSDDYSGLLVVFDPDNSILAEKLETTEAGNYALKIR